MRIVTAANQGIILKYDQSMLVEWVVKGSTQQALGQHIAEKEELNP